MLPPPTDDALDAEKLLAEGRALRALARTLVGGSDAEDVVQEGFAAALAAPVATRRGLGPWLTGTVRNLAGMLRRAETRRRGRERIAARDEVDAGSDPAVIAAQAEVIHAVAAAVKALDEPFRTVIVLRFWHGLLPEAIAQRLGVPRNTVRSRLQRGLERLRAQLDGRCGDRERWSAPLLAFAGVEPSAAASGATAGGGFLWFTVMLMKTKLLVAVAAVLAAVCCIPLWWNEPAAADQVVRAKQDPQPVAAASGVEEPKATGGEPTREEVAAPPSPPNTPAVEPPFDPSPVKVPPWLARFRVLDEDDKPVADATITIWAAKRVKLDPVMRERLGNPPENHTYFGHESTALFELNTDTEGRASTMLELECVEAAAHQQATKTGEKQLWSGRSNGVETEFVLVAPGLLCGKVVLADGTPAAGARVTARVNGSTEWGRRKPPPPEPVVTESDGRFAIPAFLHAGYDLRAELAGRRSFLEHVWMRSRTPPEVVLVFPGAISLSGTVVDADGKPVANARVRAWREFRWGDPTQAKDDYETAFSRSQPDGRFSIAVRQHRRYQLLASADGHATSELVWVQPTAARPLVEAQLVLQDFATIGGVVRHADGTPFAGVTLFARLDDPNHGAVAVPSRRDQYQDSNTSVSDANGRFGLTVHPGTNWTLVAWPQVGNPHLAIVTDGVRPGTQDLSIVIRDEDLQGCIVRGEVVSSADSRPLTAFETDVVAFVDGRPRRTGSTKQVVDGNRFELPPLPLGGQFALDVFPTDGTEQNSRPRNPGPFAPVRIGPFTTTREGVDLKVRVAPWSELPLRVLAADGKPVRNAKADASCEPRLEVVTPTGWLDTEGRVTLRNCVPGANTLRIRRENMPVHELDVTILPGLNPEVVVRLPAAGPAGTGR